MTELTPEEIQAGNRVIAEFDGWVYNEHRKLNGVSGVYQMDNKMPMLANEFRYHKDWNQIIPACRKFCEIEPNCMLGFNAGMRNTQGILKQRMAEFEILPLWKELVSAIRWYNSIKEVKS